MHHIHHTESIILESRPLRDANRLFTLFTREVGLVRASAQGVRRLDSKLRYALQEFAVARTDLIRGRELWRITSASPIKQLVGANISKDAKIAFGNVAKLANALLEPEVSHPDLYDDMAAFFTMVLAQEDKETIENLEVMIVVRLLVTLGYLPKTDLVAPLVDGAFAHVSTIPLARRELVSLINRSLRETHLM